MFCQCSGSQMNSTQVQSQPLKFRLLKSIGVMPNLVDRFLHPSKKEDYKFDRRYLSFIQFKNEDIEGLVPQEVSHIPSSNHFRIPDVQPESKTIKQLSWTKLQGIDEIPILHFAPSLVRYSQSFLMIYSHGSGSTLNNLYNFGMGICSIYKIGFLGFDFRGQGESRGKFQKYEKDLQLVLAYAIKLGYSLDKIILCGFSIGSYPVLKISSVCRFHKILISPICGLVSFIQGTTMQYEGQQYDNIENAKNSIGRTLMIHAKKQMIPVSHSHVLYQNLMKNNKRSQLQFYEIQGFTHNQIPNFLTHPDSKKLIKKYLSKIHQEVNSQVPWNQTHQKFKNYLSKLSSSIRKRSGKK